MSRVLSSVSSHLVSLVQRPDASPISLGIVLAVLMVGAFAFGHARAEQLGMELLSASVSGIDTEITLTEEIVVFGTRDENKLPEELDFLSGALLERILNNYELDQEQKAEMEWREASASLETALPRLRIGYDPREEERQPEHAGQRLLPLDLVEPATVLSVDF